MVEKDQILRDKFLNFGKKIKLQDDAQLWKWESSKLFKIDDKE